MTDHQLQMLAICLGASRHHVESAILHGNCCAEAVSEVARWFIKAGKTSDLSRWAEMHLDADNTAGSQVLVRWLGVGPIAIGLGFLHPMKIPVRQAQRP